MKDYVAENNRILKEWRDCYVNKISPEWPDWSKEELAQYFALDGIMNMGEIKPNPKTFDNGDTVFRWTREYSGKENDMWSNDPLRILYLTKDQNSYGDIAWDVRGESFRYPDENYKQYLDTKNVFYRNLAYSLYGIHKANNCCLMQYSDIVNESVVELLNSQIFARINCKKEVGGAVCSNFTLKNAIEEGRSCLKKQILNLDADIFVCCGYSQSIKPTGNLMLNFLIEIGYHFEQAVGEWIYYDKGNNKVAINSYHLSYPKFNYDGMIAAYNVFLRTHPEFLESHRK